MSRFMQEIFVSVRSMAGSAVTPHFPRAAAKATIDSGPPIDLGYTLRNGAHGKLGGTDPQSLMGE
jgi:hypothetical protein